MLPKSRRIRSREYPKGPAAKTYGAEFIKIKAFKGQNRAAIIVPNKVDARSTVRNRLRRQISAIIEAKAFPGRDLLIFVSPAAKKLSQKDLVRDLLQILDQIK